MPLLPDAYHATAEATVLNGRDEDRDKKEAKEKREKQENADRVLQGQVLEIDTIKNPPELVLGSVDGKTIVRVLKTDEILVQLSQLLLIVLTRHFLLRRGLARGTRLGVLEFLAVFLAHLVTAIDLRNCATLYVKKTKPMIATIRNSRQTASNPPPR